MSLLVWGKALEAAGAILLAYTVVRMAWLEFDIGWHLREDRSPRDPLLREVKDDMRRELERRKLQFGRREMVITCIGAFLFALGSALYLLGLVIGSH